MPIGRNHAAAGTDGQKFYIFGGRDGGNGTRVGFDDVQIYNPATDTWEWSGDPGSTIPPLPQKRGGMGKAPYYGGEFYVMGGETTNQGTGQVAGNVYNRVDVYNPVSRTWRLETPMPTARHGIFPVVADGEILVAGGGNHSSISASNVFEIFSSSSPSPTPTTTPTPTPTPTATPTPTPTPTPPSGAVRINCGGPAYVDTSGHSFLADKYFSGGLKHSYNKTITGTSDPTLYQTERSGVSLSYNVPVTNGTYTVTLDFAEMYWNAAGKRVFNVAIEGQSVLQNFDIYATAGGPQIALQRSFSVTVNDGVLNVVGTASVDQAKFSAIEIVPSGP
jgi:hypothetical protein